MKELIDAILYAASSHAGQLRKDSVTPYINHPIEVMHLLVHTGGIEDQEILMAAVLHDVIEDTSVTAEDIAERFGKNVASVVLELTDDVTQPKEERKRLQLKNADKLSHAARLVRISDKICNVYDMLYAPPGNWDIKRRKEYIEWANAVVKKIPGTNKELESHFEELIEEGFRVLES